MPKHDAVKFIKKLLLFLPLAVFFSIPIFVLFGFGELVSTQQIIQMQENRNKPILVSLAYSHPGAYYKVQYVIKLHPDVLALGDSRVLEIRSAFFKKDIKFLNGGESIYKVDDFRHFLHGIPEGLEPKIIIICLDQAYFNPGFDRSYFNADFSDTLVYSNLHNMIWMMLKDYRDKKFSLKDMFGNKRKDHFGLYAIENHTGYRNDGSTYWGKITENPDSLETKNRFNEDMAEISKGTKRFQYSSVYSPSTVNELRKFLEECRSRNIYVIGYLPPFPHRAIELMKSMGGKHAYMFKLAPVFTDTFNEFHFDFFDFTDLAGLGSSDEEAYDGIHMSEKAYLRLFLVMIRHDKKLMAYAKDPEYLEKRLSDSKGPYAVFKENEF